MSFFAEVNDNNIVERVVVVEDGRDAAWCNKFFGGGTWVETSEDGSIRKNYAGAGHTYDNVNDVFYELKPYPSWSLNEEFQWVSPTPHPNNGTPVSWDEENQTWVEIA